MRLIDADRLAENLIAARYELSGEYEKGLHEAWEIVTSETGAPTVNTWIPVKERLPEEDTWVFITFVDELSSGISIAYYNGNSWHGNIEKYDTVIAWMPLPEPYKEEK